eukprot:m.268351 g.268351  ORF g.268351 m.268351 type:complete len:207 (+) comp11076_c0_seq3:104-724(+)
MGSCKVSPPQMPLLLVAPGAGALQHQHRRDQKRLGIAALVALASCQCLVQLDRLKPRPVLGLCDLGPAEPVCCLSALHPRPASVPLGQGSIALSVAALGALVVLVALAALAVLAVLAVSTVLAVLAVFVAFAVLAVICCCACCSLLLVASRSVRVAAVCSSAQRTTSTMRPDDGGGAGGCRRVFPVPAGRSFSVLIPAAAVAVLHF